MSIRHVHAAVERRWAEEVLHLHALWRQGPPRNPSSNPQPNSSLRPVPSATFKKDPSSFSSSSKKKKKNKKNKKADQPSDPPAAQTEWPVPAPADPKPPAASWSDQVPPPAAAPRPPATAEEQARTAADCAQRNGLRAAKDFFSKDSSDDEDEEMDEGDEEELGPFVFFVELFKKDADLREHYEKNCEKGEFFCLVCSAIGVKVGKRFTNAVALVQHANSVSKTKRREAHRALARAVCQVLGWDINRLPSFVLDMGQTLGQSLSKSKKTQEGMEKGSTSVQDNGSLENKEDIQKENVDGKETDLMHIADSIEITAVKIISNENEQKGGDANVMENAKSSMDCMPTKDALPSSDKEDATENKDELSKDSLEIMEVNDTNPIENIVNDDESHKADWEDILLESPL